MLFSRGAWFAPQRSVKFRCLEGNKPADFFYKNVLKISVDLLCKLKLFTPFIFLVLHVYSIWACRYISFQALRFQKKWAASTCLSVIFLKALDNNSVIFSIIQDRAIEVPPVGSKSLTEISECQNHVLRPIMWTESTSMLPISLFLFLFLPCLSLSLSLSRLPI